MTKTQSKRWFSILPDQQHDEHVYGTTNTAPFSDADRLVIRDLAAGNKLMLDTAVMIFRAVLRGKKPEYERDPYFAFMSEVDNPCPCYVLKANARAEILKG
jgi:hypothetical protein